MRLLLLEDDNILGLGLRAFLMADGHAVDWCQRLEQAKSLRNESFDALLVDWQLPDGSGLDWVRDLRARGDKTPVVILTARDLLSDRSIPRAAPRALRRRRPHQPALAAVLCPPWP